MAHIINSSIGNIIVATAGATKTLPDFRLLWRGGWLILKWLVMIIHDVRMAHVLLRPKWRNAIHLLYFKVLKIVKIVSRLYSIPSLNASSSLATAHNHEFWALAKTRCRFGCYLNFILYQVHKNIITLYLTRSFWDFFLFISIYLGRFFVFDR